MRADRNSSLQLASLIFFVTILLPSMVIAEVCPSESEVDQVPFFVRQIYSDVLNRAPDGPGGKGYISQITDFNSKTCRSGKPNVLAGNCEWDNAARMGLALVSSEESVSKNGSITSNRGFVAALFRVLLGRTPQNAGLQTYVSALDRGVSRQNVVFSLLSSDEYRRRFACSTNRQARAAVPQTGKEGRGFALGVNGHPLTQKVYSDSGGIDFDAQLKAVQDAGAEWYRVDMTISPTVQDYSMMDSLLKKAQAHGVKLLPILVAQVDRAHDSPSTIYQKAHDAAVNVVRHYKSSIHVWELSNEEDNKCIYKGASGDRPADFDTGKYAVVSAVLRGLSEGVHDADPSASRMIDFAGWLHTGFFERLEADHIDYEIVGVHWYGDYGDIACPGQSSPCPGNPKHFNVVQRLQTITKGKPMWMTETNYRPRRNNTEEMHTYLSRVLRNYAHSPKAYPFEVIVIYELLDEPEARGGATESQMGLFPVTRSPDGKYAIGQAKQAVRVLRTERSSD